MTERPIIFSAPMVKAILEGRKTQTRRVILPVQPRADGMWPGGRDPVPDCPYGRAGDRLWIRESGWQRPERSEHDLREGADTWPPFIYSAGGEDDWCRENRWIRRPSIHMQRKFSRITLELRAIRLARVQDISAEECQAEGVQIPVNRENGHALLQISGRFAPSNYLVRADLEVTAAWWRAHFAGLWDSINSARGYGWSANPWVWVLEFGIVK